MNINELLPSIFSNLPVGICVYENQKLVYANREMEHLTGYPVNELLENENLAFLSCPDYRNEVEQIMSNLATQTQPFEYGIIHKQGEPKYLNNTIHKLENFDNLIYTISIDNTEFRNTVAELEKRTDEFASIANYGQAFIIRFNRDFKCTYANNAIEAAVGISPDKMQGLELKDIGFSDHTQAILKKMFIDCFSRHKKRNIEYQFQSIKGKRTIEATIIPEISTRTNTVHSLLLVNNDVTSHRQAIDKVAQKERHYRMLANNMTDIVWILNLKREILYVSPSVERVLGYKPDDFINKAIETTYTHESKDTLLVALNSIIKHIKLGEHEKIRRDITLELHQYHKDLTIRYFETVLNVQPDEYGKYVGIIGVARDVTVRRTAEIELRNAREKEIEVDKRRTTFLANMIHEIRTPLNGIVRYVDMLNNQAITSVQRDSYIEQINISTTKLAGLIDNIVDISKIEAGLLTINIAPADVNQLIENVIRIQLDKLKKAVNREIKLKFNKNEELLIADIDTARFEQVMTILIENSINFTHSGSVIVSYERKKTQIIISISDTGIGFSSEMIERVFDRNYNCENDETRLFGSAGLGLSIAKNLVELMNGKIWVEPNIDNGITFYFTIPNHITYCAATTVANETNHEIVNSKELKNIMIVEDDEINYQYIREILSDEPYRLFWVQDGQQAVELVNIEPIDLILMDIKLPRMNGYEATKHIKSSHPNVKIIAQTAYTDYKDVVASLESGCDDFIAKPSRPRKLKSLIERYLKETELKNQ